AHRMSSPRAVGTRKVRLAPGRSWLAERTALGVRWSWKMSAPTDELSPLLELLAQVEREVHLRRQAVLDLVSPLEAALSTYRRAVEEELMTTYATSHQHKLPRVTTRGRRAAAEQL